MVKVLFLINTLCGGGAEKVLVDTVNSLDQKKYQITVQTIFDEGIYKKYLNKNIRYKTIIKTKNKFLKRAATKILIKICGTKFMYNHFVSDDYDYEIAFLEGLPTKIISESTEQNIKKFAWIHTDLNAFPDSYYAYGSTEKEEFAYKKFDKVFCVSEGVKYVFLNKYGIEKGKAEVLYNVINDENIINKAKEDVELPSEIRPMFISVGRLVEQKGYERLLKIHNKLIKEGLRHTLLIVGNGEKREELEKYIKNNNLEETAFLIGHQDNPYKYISKADLFICSSIAEGFSTVVSESVLCGTPVLSTDVAGSREPFDMPRCSIIVENDEGSLYTELHNLLKQPTKIEELKTDLCEKRAMLKKNRLIENFEKKVFNNF